MKKKLAILAAIVMMVFTSVSFAMDSWVKTYGDGNYLKDHTVIKTSDGGSLIVGCEVQGSNDGGFALKLDANGAITWKKRYGDSNWYTLFSAVELSDCYLLVGGKANSYYKYGLILKVSKSDGSITWQREYDGISYIHSIKQNVAGNDFVIAGWYSYGFSKYFVVMALGQDLYPDWRTAISGPSNKPMAGNIFEASGNDLLCIVPSKGTLVRIDGATGDVEWEKRYKDPSTYSYIYINSMCRTSTGTFAVAGQIFVSGYGLDYVTMMVDENGSIVSPSAKKFGTEYGEWPTSITESSDGSFLMVGRLSMSTDPKSTIQFFKLNSDFSEVLWQKQLSDGTHWMEPSSGQIHDYAGEIHYTGIYRPSTSSSSNNAIVFAKLNPEGESGQCGFLSDLSLTLQSLTPASQSESTTVDDSLYFSYSGSAPSGTMVGLEASSLCNGFYPTLSVDLLNSNQGRVEGKLVIDGEPTGDPIINCGDGEMDCWEILEQGTQVQLTVYPKPGYTFSYWFDGVNYITDNPMNTTAYINSSYQAVFTTFELEFPIRLNNYTPYSAPVSSVFDHSGDADYGDDNEVIAFNGEKGEENTEHPAYSGTTCYEKSDESAFGSGFNYAGISGAEEYYLCYDGHPGFDYAVSTGTDLYSAAAGITHYGYNSCLGNYVEIEHAGGYVTKYFHMNSIDTGNVQQYQFIEAGVKIGTSGNTGSCSDGAHLHFQVERDGIPVDPYGWTGTGTDPYTRSKSVVLWE